MRTARPAAAILGVMTSLWLTTPQASAAGTVVTLTADNTFAPSTIEVGVGDAVTFSWGGGFHNVVFDDGTRSGDPTDQAGVEWSRTFTAPGTYPYVCEVHASISMIGSVTVSETAGNSGNAGGGGNNAGNGDNGDNADSGNNAGNSGNQGASSYPSTGPESGLLPDIGFLLLAGGGTGYLIEKRRRARRRS